MDTVHNMLCHIEHPFRKESIIGLLTWNVSYWQVTAVASLRLTLGKRALHSPRSHFMRLVWLRCLEVKHLRKTFPGSEIPCQTGWSSLCSTANLYSPCSFCQPLPVEFSKFIIIVPEILSDRWTKQFWRSGTPKPQCWHLLSFWLRHCSRWQLLLESLSLFSFGFLHISSSKIWPTTCFEFLRM